MTTHRQQRIAELLKEELGLLISSELDDPRLEDAMLTVTRVTVSQDLRNARVYVEHVLPRESSPQVLQALSHAEGFLRQAVLQNLNLRFAPQFTFQIDETGERARRVDKLLDSISHPVPEQEGHELDDLS